MEKKRIPRYLVNNQLSYHPRKSRKGKQNALFKKISNFIRRLEKNITKKDICIGHKPDGECFCSLFTDWRKLSVIVRRGEYLKIITEGLRVDSGNDFFGYNAVPVSGITINIPSKTITCPVYSILPPRYYEVSKLGYLDHAIHIPKNMHNELNIIGNMLKTDLS